MSLIQVSRHNFSQEVLEAKEPVLLDFWAPWCGPCRALGPIIEEVAAERSDVKVCKINVDDQPELAAQFGIMSIPTLVVMNGGKQTCKSVGAISKAQILSML